MQRRELVGGGLLAGLTALATASPAVAAQSDDPRSAAAIDRLRQTVEGQFEAA
jgi:hypothetical protein